MWPIVVKDDLHNNTVERILQYKEHYYVYIKYTMWIEGLWPLVVARKTIVEKYSCFSVGLQEQSDCDIPLLQIELGQFMRFMY